MNIFQDSQTYYDPYSMSRHCSEKSPKLFEPQEAIMLGNLFKDLYMTYNGFSNYCLQPSSARQQSLLEVQMYTFVAHEINLYLDTHPTNQRMIQLFNEYSKKAEEASEAYEKQYGPLMVDNSSNQTPFQWVQGPWPWEHQN